MPSLESWLEKPLDTIQGILDHDPNAFEMIEISKYFAGRLNADQEWTKIPSLNSTPIEMLKPHSLVKFRGMVQDMYDPEYFLGVFETADNSNNQKSLLSGMMRDHPSCKENHTVLNESPKNKYMERQPFYCVQIPGEATWVKEKSSACQLNTVKPIPSENSKQAAKKRGRDEDDEMMDCSGEQTSTSNDLEQQKRTKHAASNGTSSNSQPMDLNFPLTSETRMPCLVKMYHRLDSEAVKLNEVVEFVGVLDIDSSFASTEFSDDQDSNGWPQIETKEERLAHSPPSSLVPRLHCLLHRKLNHTNPLLPQTLSSADEIASLLSDINDTRSSLQQLLSHILFGDDLAAELVILNLIAKVYGRASGLALGKFALNLSNCETTENQLTLARELYTIIEAVTTKSNLFEMTLENLNRKLLSPSKDYDANRLRSGGLQLADGTHLILDENAMASGKLEDVGVRNAAAFEKVILFQKVEYDFQFHKTEMNTDLGIIVISEGKSFLQTDCHVPVTRTSRTSSPTALSLLRTLPAVLLDKMRTYITIVREINTDINEDIQTLIQDYFVELRKTAPDTITVDSLHLLLTLSRLLGMSYGQKNMTKEIWEKTKDIFTNIIKRQEECKRASAPES